MKIVQQNLGQGQVIQSPHIPHSYCQGHGMSNAAFIWKNLESFGVKFDDRELCLEKLVSIHLQERQLKG